MAPGTFRTQGAMTRHDWAMHLKIAENRRDLAEAVDEYTGVATTPPDAAYFAGADTAFATAVAAFSTSGVSMSSPFDCAVRLSVMSTRTFPSAFSRCVDNVISSLLCVLLP